MIIARWSRGSFSVIAPGWRGVISRSVRPVADGVEAASSFRYRRDLDMLLRVIQSEADAAGRVDWLVSVDSSIVRAHQHSAPPNVLFGRIVRGSKSTRGSVE